MYFNFSEIWRVGVVSMGERLGYEMSVFDQGCDLLTFNGSLIETPSITGQKFSTRL